jgi:hypothetical protein
MQASGTLMEQSGRQRRRGGLVGPTILIALGIVFLLNNLGYLSWGIWDSLLRLWPVVLIAVGLDLLVGRRSMLGSALVALLVLLGLCMAVWWSGFWLPNGIAIVGETINQPLGGARSADVDIGMGAGQLHIGALAESDNLIEGRVDRAGNEQIARTFTMNGDTAVFGLKSRAAWPFMFGERRSDGVEWDLRLNRAIPLRLHIDTGAGQAALDLARLHIANLEINTGVGQTTLTLPQEGQFAARINGGIGQVVVTIPAGMAARIVATTGLGQVNITGNFQRNGNVSVSPGYDGATNRVDLTVNGGIGSLVIRQESGR